VSDRNRNVVAATGRVGDVGEKERAPLVLGNVWPALAETLGVETGPDMPTSVAAYLEENADVWDEIVAKYNLRSRNLRELVGQGDQHADFAFAYGAREGPRAFVSTIKLRQAGFTKTIDTEDSFRNALQSLIDHKLLPPAAK
jgi:hypothetical protein